MAGVFLDTAWHRTLGRDSFFLLPHLFVYAGGLGIWSAAVAAIAVATRGGDAGGPTLSVGGLRLPLGFTLAALGVLTVGAAAPVDIWWHSRYGKDALIWSFPHLMGHFGAGLAAVGLLFAVAGRAGHGWFARARVWRAAMLLIVVDLVHRALFVLAHYTMVPATRTPDFYPFLASLTLPLVLVTAARALGPWAPTLAALLFLGLALAVDALLRALEFERYTVTPLVAAPALALSLAARALPRHRDHAGFAVAAGLLFTLVFTAMEAGSMAWVVGRPWPVGGVLGGLPRSLAAGALSGWVGWALGGFLRAVGGGDGIAGAFGSARRTRAVATAAVLLVAAGLISTHAPQRFGPPMAVEELALTPLPSISHPDAVFWDVLLQEGWHRAERLEGRSEGVIDGFPLPVGPAWCAPTDAALAADLARVRFGLEVNGTPVELSRFPIVRTRAREGAWCAWVGVASRFQRASENRFRYTIDFAEPVSLRPVAGRLAVEMAVIFKDP